MNTQTPAQKDYAQRHDHAKALLVSISAALAAHAVKAAAQPGNWGFSGDMGAAEGRLMELLELLES